MLATDPTNTAATSAQPIGSIELLIGAAVAVAVDGRERVVVVGDALYEGEVVKVDGQSTVEIRLADNSLQRLRGDDVHAAKLLLAQNDTAATVITDAAPALVEQPTAGELAAAVRQAVSENRSFSELLEQAPAEVVAAVIAALPADIAVQVIAELPPAALGSEQSDGHSFVLIPHDLPQPIPEAGFPTGPFSYSYPEGIDDGGLTEELGTPLEPAQLPSLNIIKSNALTDADNSGGVSAGDIITYTYVVENTGSVILTGVTVTDDKLGAAALSDVDGDGVGTLAVGATETATLTYTVTAADVAAGSIVNVATADSDQTGPDADSNTVTVPAPSLNIDKSNLLTDADNSGGVSAGDIITYTYAVKNAGAVTLTGVSVTDDKLGPVTLSDGGGDGVGTLAAGATETATLTYTVTAADVAAGAIVNVATADSNQTGPSTDTNTVLLPSLNVTKSNVNNDVDGSGGVSAGDIITYTFAVQNTGPVALTGVTVTDDKLGLATLSDGGGDGAGTLAAGVTETATLTYMVTAADVAAGSIVNVATADSNQTGPDTDTNTVLLPSLNVIKSNAINDVDGSGGVSAGDIITYTYTVQNTGAVNLTNVTVVDDKLGAATLTDGGGDGVGTLAVGATETATLAYTVTAADVAAGSIVNVATADSDQSGPDTDSNTVTVPAPSLNISKSNVLTDADGSGDVSAGDTITYTYTVQNTGTANLTGVTVVDDKLGAATLTDGGSDGVGTVAAGATESATLTYVVQAGDVGTAITNVATADSDQTGPDTDSNTVTVPAPSLDISKSNVLTDTDGSGDVSVGDTITYTYTVQNTGTANLTGVTVVDDKLGAATLSDGGGDGVGTVAAGATETATLTYTVTAADVAAGAIVNVATADSDQSGPDTDSNTVTVPAPSLNISKSNVLTDTDGSADVSAGDTITYTYTVQNTGTANLTGVTVVDDKLGAATLSDGGGDGVGVIAAGATETATLTYTVTAADVAAGSIVNVATADSDQSGPDTDSNTVTVPAPSLDISKSNVLTDADGSGDVSAGDTITYTYTVQNTGTANLTNVTVADDKLGAVTLTAGLSDVDGDAQADDLAVGATATGTADYVVQAADVAAGSIVNVATADSDQSGPDTDSNTVTVVGPSLDITKSNALTDTDGSGDVSAGDTITYTYTVQNTGTANLTGVTVVDDKLGGATLTDGGGDGVGTLAAGATETATLTYVVQAGDVGTAIVNVATADSDQTGPDTDSNTVTVPAPSLDITKSNVLADTDGSGDVSAGDTITYTYTVQNIGTANLTNVTVVDDKLGAVALTAGLSDIDGDTQADDLAVGATGTGTADYVVTAADVAAGSIVNVATADSDQSGPDTDSNTVTVPAPSLDISKSNVLTDTDGSGDVSVGDTITYTYTVQNTGTANLTGVTVVDDKLGAATLSDGGGDGLGTVAAGATETATLTYTVTAADVAAGSIVNVATADSDQSGPDTDSNTVTVPAPSLDISKSNVLTDTDGSGDVSAGDTITYTYTVQNTGTANLTNVTVVDDKLGAATLSDGGGDGVGVIAAGATETATLTYTVTAADVAAGSIVNVATADSDQSGPDTDSNTVTAPAPSLDIIKTNVLTDTDGSGDVSAGDTIIYSYTVQNTGTANLTGVTVVDDKLGAATLSDGGGDGVGTLAAGATETAALTYTVTAADVAAGAIVNVATADSDQSGPDTDSNTVRVPAPSLSISKSNVLTDTDGSGDVSAGDTITYTYTVQNTGTANLTGVTVVDDKLGAATLTDGGGDGVGTLAAGATETATLTYTVAVADVAAGSIVNVATADSDQSGPDTDSNTVRVPAPSLDITKSNVLTDTDVSGDVSVGDTLTYTYTVQNIGTANLTNVTVVDDKLGAATLSDTGGDGLGTLAAGATETATLTYMVQAGDLGTAIVNVATADSDQTGPDTDTNTVTVPAPSLDITKSNVLTDTDGSGDVSVGDTIAYSYTVQNTGTANLTGVTVVDDKLGAATLSDGGGDGVGVIAAGATETAALTYVVQAGDLGTAIINVATADSDQTGPDTDTNTVTVPAPSLDISKSNVLTDADGSGDVSVGDTIAYSYTVQNTGTANLTGVTVVDDKLGAATLTDGGGDGVGTLAAGATETATLTYTVTAVDVGTAITNVATADSDQSGPDTDSNTVTVPTPSLDISKSNVLTDSDGSGDVSVGDTITYTYSVQNIGTANLTNVTVVDDKLGPATLTDGGGDGVGTLAAGAIETAMLTYTVQAGDLGTAIVNVATADSDQTGPDTDTNTVTVPTPTLNITKSNVLTDTDGSGDVSAGDTITYTYTVQNTGTANLTGVTVTDDLLGAATLSDVAGDGVGVIAAGATESATLTYVVQAGDVGTAIINVATADSDQTGPDTDTNTVTVPATEPSLDISKTNVLTDADGSGDVSVGDTVTYTYAVFNTGNATLTNVTVTDDLLGAATLSDGGGDGVGVIAAGATETATLTYVVTAGDVGTAIVNVATADSDQTGPDTDTNTVTVPAPNLNISKSNVLTDTDGSGDVSVGDTITYTYTVQNTGTANLTGVTVTDDLLGAATLSDVAGDGVGVIAAGATESATLTYVVQAGDVGTAIINVATADSDQTGPDTDTNTVTVPAPQPSLDISKTNVLTDADVSGDVSVGDTITYTYAVFNTGNATLTNVTVTDDLLGAATLSDVAGDGVGVIAAGATETATLTYVVTAGDVGTAIVNVATADSDQTGPDTDTNTVTVPAPTLNIAKSNVISDPDGSGDVSVGDVITYSYTVQNTGTANLTGVTVTDDLLGAATLSDVAGDGVGAIAAGDTESATLTYVVQAGDVGTAIINVATADSDQTGPDTDTNTVTVPATEPSLDISKTNVLTDADGSGDVSAGDTITYTYAVFNTGNATLTNVTVTDDLLGAATLSDVAGDGVGVIAAGATETATLTYVVRAADVAAGSIVNVATADSDQTGPDTDTNTVTVPAPTLNITKSNVISDPDGSGDVSVGDVVTYSYTVQNTGTANLTGVTVTDDLLGAATLSDVAGDGVGVIAAGATESATLTYVVTAGDVGTAIINVATADSDQTGPDTDTNTVTVPAPTLNIAKSNVISDPDGSGDVSVGDTITYTYTVQNTGTANLTGVTVTDDLLGAATLSDVAGDGVGVIAVGATESATLTYVVQAGDVGTAIINVATADSDQTGPDTDSNTVTVPAPTASLDISKTNVLTDADGSGDVSAGDTITYTYAVFNTGNATLTNVTVTDDLLGAATLSDVAGDGVGVIAAGATETATLTYVVQAGDVGTAIVNVATADSDQTGPDTDTNTVTVPAPSLDISKSNVLTDTDGSGDVSVGDTITYTYTVQNTGTANLTGVTVVDDKLGAATLSDGGGDGVGVIAVGATESATLTYVVTAGDVGTAITNVATADSDQTGPDTDTNTVTVPAPTLNIAKSNVISDPDGSGDVSVGDVITYSYTVQNTGTANLTGVTVTDDLLGAATLSDVAGDGVGAIAAGDTESATLTYVVQAGDVGTAIINVATADSDQTGPDTDTNTVTVPATEPSLDISKTNVLTDADGSGDVSAGDTITYTYAVFNTGNATLTNVTVTDDLLGAATLSDVAGDGVGVIAAGATETATLTYVVRAADVAAGSIVNVATADSDQTGPDTDTNTVTVPAPTLNIAKSNVISDPDGSGDVSVGDVVTYTYTVQNTGTANLTGVTVTDDLLGAATLSDVAGDGVGVIAVGATESATLTYVVQAGDVGTAIINVATADSDQTGPDTDTNTVTVPAPTASLDISKTNVLTDADGSGDVSAGDTITYTYVVFNTGNATLSNVTVTDDLLGAATLSDVAGNGVGVIEEGGTESATLTYVVQSGDVGTAIINVATADSDQTGPDTDTNTVTVPAPTASLDISKTNVLTDADGSGDVSAGDTITYTYAVFNTGNATLSNVTVTDDLLGAATLSDTGGDGVGTLAVGATESATLTYVVQAGDVGTAIINVATADSDQTGPDTDSNTVTVPAPTASLDISKTNVLTDADGSGDVSAGDTITYTYVVFNTGNATLSNVTVTDDLLGAATLSDVAGNGVGVIEEGGTESATLTYVVQAGDVGTAIINVATADSDQTGPDTDTNTVTVPAPTASLDISKTNVLTDADGSGDVSAGDTITYTYAVFNTGNATLTNVTVTDDLLGVATLTDGAGDGVGTLAVGGTETATLSYVVQSGDVGTAIINVATADSDQTGPDTDSNTVTVPAPTASLDISKTNVLTDVDGSGDVSVGDTITYTYVVFNTGNATLSNVTVTDDLLGAATLSDVAGNGVGVIEEGGTESATLTYVVQSGDVGTAIINVATADSDQTGPDTDTNTVTVPAPTASLDISKTNVLTDADSSGDVSAGDTITYTYAVFNTGNATLSNVTVTDDLLGAATLSDTGGDGVGTLAVGATESATLTYVVQAGDVGTAIINVATADSDQTGPDTDSNTVTVPAPTPSLDISKTNVLTDADVSGDVSVGDTISYTYAVFNTGNATLTNVTVTDDLLGAATLSDTGGDGVGTLASGATETATLSYVVQSGDVGTAIINVATADSDQTGPDTDSNTVTVPAPSLDISKMNVLTDTDGSSDVSAGDTITYTYTVQNTGTANLTNVTVVDDKLGAATLSDGGGDGVGTLAAGATETATLSYVVQSGDVGTAIINVATADSDQTGPDTDSNTVTVPAPSLDISKTNVLTDTDGSGDVSVGDTITYTYTVQNTGTANLTGVTVTDDLLGAATLTDGAGDGVGVIAAGDSESATLTYVVQSGDVGTAIINVATADSDQTGPDTDSNTVTVPTPTASLDISKTNVLTDVDDSGDVSVGDTITYTYTIQNTGTANLTNVTVVDDKLGAVTLTAGLSDIDGDTQADDLAVGATATGTADYVVSAADVVTGSIVNVATADSDQAGPDTDSNTVTVPAPSLDIIKTNVLTDADGSGDVSVGDVITYTYTVQNTGTANLTNVTVVDDKLGAVTLSAGLSDIDGDTQADDLAVGATATGTADFVVTAADVAKGSIVNVATADSDQSGPDTDSNTVPVPAPSLDISKSNVLTDADGSGDVSAGDTITYTYRVQNTGAANLTNVTVVDDKLGAVTLTAGLSDIDGDTQADDLAVGATATGAADYVVTAADVAAGSIVNVVTADSDQSGPDTDTNTVTVPAPSLDITKTNVLTDADGSGDVSAGDTITYTYRVQNTGAANLTNVTVVDDKLGAVTLTAGLSDIDGDTQADDLAVGATATGTADYVVTAADVAAGSILNVVTADSDQSGPGTDTNTVTVPAPSLDISKTNVLTDADGSGDVSVGDVITYTYTIQNTGTANLTGVTVVDDKLGAATLSDGGGDGVGTLASGATETATLSYVVTAADVAAGSIVNIATVDSDQAGPDTDSNTVTVPAPSLDISKTNVLTDADGSGDVSAGDTITYTYRVQNTGAANLTNVTVVDDKLGAVTLTAGLSDIDGDTQADDLAVGATATGTADYVVQSGDVGTAITNVATADSDQTGPDTDTNTVTVPAPSLDIIKTNVLTDADGSGDVSAGDTITYTYRVQNTGAANLTNVTVVDDKLGAVTLTAGLSDIDGDMQADDLAVGATATGAADYVVTAADVAAGSILNVVTADSDQSGPDTDTNTVTVPAPSLDISKTNVLTDADGSGDVSAGDTITYTYTVQNIGTANLTGVTVTDDLLGAATLSDVAGDGVGVIAAGDGESATLTYVVQSGDVGTAITNVATADSDQSNPVTDGNTVTVPAPSLNVTKSNVLFDDADNSGGVSAGDTIRYTYTVQNTGTANLTNVTVVDDKLGAVTLTSGLTDIDGDAQADDLVVAATATGTADYVVTATDVTAGSIVNVATADSDQTGPDTDSNTVPVPSLLPTTLSISDAMVREGTPFSPSPDIAFTVTRAGDLSMQTTVNFSVQAGTAVAINDYTGMLGGQLTFAPNEVTKLITLNVVDDLVPEPNQQFTVGLSNPSNATLVIDAGGNASQTPGVGTGVIKELVIDLDGNNSSLTPATHSFGADPNGIVANFESSYELNEVAGSKGPAKIADQDAMIFLADNGDPITQATITLLNPHPSMGDGIRFTNLPAQFEVGRAGDTWTLTLAPGVQAVDPSVWAEAISSAQFVTTAAGFVLETFQTRFVSIQVEDGTGSSNVALTAITPFRATAPELRPTSVFTVGDLNSDTAPDVITGFDQGSGFNAVPQPIAGVNGDVLELSDLIQGTPTQSTIDGFVTIDQNGVVSVDSNGSTPGVDPFAGEVVAVLDGITSGAINVLVGDHDSMLQVNVV